MSGDPDPERPAQALQASLQPFVDRHDGRIVMVGDVVWSVVLNEREQVISQATEVPAGGWVVSTTEGCAGYER